MIIILSYLTGHKYHLYYYKTTTSQFIDNHSNINANLLNDVNKNILTKIDKNLFLFLCITFFRCLTVLLFYVVFDKNLKML